MKLTKKKEKSWKGKEILLWLYYKKNCSNFSGWKKKKKNHLFGLTGSIFIGIFIFLCRKGGGGGVLEKKEKWQW